MVAHCFPAKPVPDGGPADAGRGGRRQLRAGAVRVRHRGHAARAARAHAPRHRRVPASHRARRVAASPAQVRFTIAFPGHYVLISSLNNLWRLVKYVRGIKRTFPPDRRDETSRDEVEISLLNFRKNCL